MSLHVSATRRLLTGLLALTTWVGGCSEPTANIPHGKAGGPLPATVVISGYRDLKVNTDGSLTPIFIKRNRPIKLCFDSQVDTSSWQPWATLRETEHSVAAPMELAARLGDITCYQTPLPDQHDAEEPLVICWQVYDSYEETLFDGECRSVRYRPDDSTYDALLDRYHQIDLSKKTATEELLRLAQTVEERGYPVYGVRLRFIVVDRLRKAGEVEAAHAQLKALPSWLKEPEAVAFAALAERNRAQLFLSDSKLQSAWRHLEAAERLARPIAPSWRIYISVLQANLLHRVGSLNEGIERLEESLDSCGPAAPCNELRVAEAKSLLYWMRALRLDASQSELAEVEQGMEEILPKLRDTSSQIEAANYSINLAYFHVLRHHDPARDLAVARGLLDTATPEEAQTARYFQLRAWTDLVEGLGAASVGDARKSLDKCRQAARYEEDPYLSAWSTSCVGHAHRQLGNPEAALRAFEQALTLHEYATTIDLEQQIDRGPGQRAEDFYQAARAAADLGKVDRALEILEQLDRFSTDEQLRSLCRARAKTAESLAQWRHNTERTNEVFRQLRDKAKAVTGTRKEANDESVRQLKQELQTLLRALPGCADLLQATAAPGATTVGWRVAALPDEILLFHRAPVGKVTLIRRPIDRRDLRDRVDQIGAALERRTIDDEQWRRLTRPLAEALIPPQPETLQPQTRFALHGFLQGVPLAALPVDEDTSTRWLADFTTPILQPAFRDVPQPASSIHAPLHGLFVVDPKSNLASTPEQAEFYRQAAPEAVLLRGSAATAGALQQQLTTASFLHLDVHALFDPIFPELSSIELADQELRLDALAALPAPPIFANLSGCGTGRWPTTADAGRFGLAGVFARRGTHWVIASRNVIRDRLLRDFNMAFYRNFATTTVTPQHVPQLYATALRQLRQSYPATEWASLFLLIGRKNYPSRGQETTLATPLQLEAVPLARDKRASPDSQGRRSPHSYADHAEPIDATTRFR